jgi:hypothetical protein
MENINEKHIKTPPFNGFLNYVLPCQNFVKWWVGWREAPETTIGEIV